MEEQTQHRTTTSARLRFVLGQDATEVALPAEATLTDLLPAVLPRFGAEAIEAGGDHEGWVVQRIGEPPLDEDRTLAELNLLDGETVYLRPRADQLAPIDFDDLVAGIGDQVREHPGAWRPVHSRWLFRIAAVAALLLGLLVIPGAGVAVVQAVVALSLAVVLLVGAGLASRGVADSHAATIFAGASACYGALGGVLLVHAYAPLAGLPVEAAVAFAVALLLLSIGAFVVADSGLLFAGAITFVLVLALTGLLGAVTPASPAQAAGIGIAAGLLFGMLLPATAFRLSGLTLPMLPGDKDELSDDIEPVPATLVVERGALIFGYSTALHAGLGAALAVLLPVLVAGGGDWPAVLSLVVAALLLLRSRHPRGVVQRWAVIVPAAAAMVADLHNFVAGQGDLPRLLAVCGGLVVVGVLMVLAARLLPGKRQRPYWGRAAEIFESLTALAVIPILLQVLGVFAWMRGLAG